MKKYYVVNMVLKDTQAKDESFSIGGRYIVNDEDELQAIAIQLATDFGKDVSDFDIHYEVSSLAEFINAEESIMRTAITDEYLKRNSEKYPFLPAREYLDLLHHIEDNLYYEILLEENKLRRIEKIIRRKVVTNSITLAQYDEMKLALLHAKDNDEYDMIIRKYSSN